MDGRPARRDIRDSPDSRSADSLIKYALKLTACDAFNEGAKVPKPSASVSEDIILVSDGGFRKTAAFV